MTKRRVQEFGISQCDCRDGLASLADESVALTHTSPPYNIKRGYSGFEDSQQMEEYVALVRDVLKLLFRVTRPGGSVFWQVGYTGLRRSKGEAPGIITLDSLTLPIAAEVGFVLWDRIIWNYRGSMAFKSKFTNRHETILWLVKPPDSPAEGWPTFRLDEVRERSLSYDGRNHILGRNPGNVWYSERVAFGSAGQTSHIAVFPEEVSERIVRACSDVGDLVLDPFAGSGTLPKVARSLGRRTGGFEISDQYVSEGRRRLGMWGHSEPMNLAIGLLVKYVYHRQAGSHGVRSAGEYLASAISGEEASRKVRELEDQIQRIAEAQRVTRAVKEEKQKLWARYDEVIDAGDEGDQVVAADRALSFCFAHRRRWNGLRRYLDAARQMNALFKEIRENGGAERYLKQLAQSTPERFRLDGSRLHCLCVDAGLGCNGSASAKKQREPSEPETLSLFS